MRPTRTKSSGAETSAHSPPGMLVASPALRAAKPTDNQVAYLRNLHTIKVSEAKIR